MFRAGFQIGDVPAEGSKVYSRHNQCEIGLLIRFMGSSSSSASARNTNAAPKGKNNHVRKQGYGGEVIVQRSAG